MYNGFILASTFDYSPDFCGTERKFIPKPLKDVGEGKNKKDRKRLGVVSQSHAQGHNPEKRSILSS